MKAELLATLLTWAVTISGYPQPAGQPRLERASQHQLQDWACNRFPCPILSWYDEQNTVYLAGKIDLARAEHQAVVVHEFVHFLQHEAGDVGRTCKRVMMRERKAHAVEATFLARSGLPTWLGVVHGPMVCR